MTADEDTAGLVASVLADLYRKRRPWGRQRFRTFMEAAIRIRSVGHAGVEEAALVSVAWSDGPRRGSQRDIDWRTHRADPSKWPSK